MLAIARSGRGSRRSGAAPPVEARSAPLGGLPDVEGSPLALHEQSHGERRTASHPARRIHKPYPGGDRRRKRGSGPQAAETRVRLASAIT